MAGSQERGHGAEGVCGGMSMKIWCSNDATNRGVTATHMQLDVLYRHTISGEIYIRVSNTQWLRVLDSGIVLVTIASTDTFERLPKDTRLTFEQTS